MEIFFTKKNGDAEMTMNITFDAKSCEDCAQAAFHATSFFDGNYGFTHKSARDITPEEIKAAFEKEVKAIRNNHDN